MTELENHSAAGTAFLLEGVSKRFDRVPVLRDLNLTIRRGERVAVIGPSGAGKTTLLRLLSAVIWPSEGRIVALGHDTRRLRGAALRGLRREIGLLYQNDNLVPGLRVVHNVLMGRLGRWGLPRSLISLLWPRELDAARQALREVEVEEKLWELPAALSGGQQQRVAIARLIVQRPAIMLADEPVSQLDMRLGREVIRLLAELAQRRAATLIVSLHSLDLLGEHFQRVIALKDGTLFWDGSPRALSAGLLADLYGAEYRQLRLDELALPDEPADIAR